MNWFLLTNLSSNSAVSKQLDLEQKCCFLVNSKFFRTTDSVSVLLQFDTINSTFAINLKFESQSAKDQQYKSSVKLVGWKTSSHSNPQASKVGRIETLFLFKLFQDSTFQ